MQDIVDIVVKAPLHSLYYIFGYQVPSVLTKVLVKAPIAAFEKVVGMNEGILREADWIMVAARYDAKKRREVVAESQFPGWKEESEVTKRYTDGSDFSSLDFFGFRYNKDPVLREQCFSNERYPYPLYDGHFHTILGDHRCVYSDAAMGYTRDIVTSDFDGNTLHLEWSLCDVSKYPKGPKAVIAIIPGLTSTCQSNYLQHFVRHATANGYHVVVLCTRGIGNVPLDSGTMSCGTFTSDVEFLLERHLTKEYINNKFGHADLKLMAVGFSLGASLLCSHLGKVRENTRLHCGVAACAPWDYHSFGSSMSSSFALLTYQPALSGSLLSIVKTKGQGLLERSDNEELNANVSMLLKATKKGIPRGYTVQDVERLIVCPNHGHATVMDYYTAASPFQHLHKVEVPLMCFSALDDPIVGTPPSLRRWDFVCEANPNLLYVRSPTGGHLGFMRGPVDELLGRPGYLEERIIKALDVAARQPTKKPVRRDVPDQLEEYHLSSEHKA
eukprot:GILI01015832.1.p1 GENE.GILI01015832.1~~GILI01015832.1.p1  ORF type:complete len:511 (-),score=95.90 GILI01015832.1:231-1730(-)